MRAKQVIENLLLPIGVQLNGPNPWDMQVHNERLYARILSQSSLGLGEAYMEGWWDCEQLDVLFEKICSAKIYTHFKYNLSTLATGLYHRIVNAQTLKLSRVVGKVHYDLGTDLFEAMLGPTMAYSCGYWDHANSLDKAQQFKYQLVCDKLYLQPGMRVLDIGCGWGGMARYLCERYDVELVGVTISKAQYEYAKKQCQGLPIDIRLQDYREINDQFDRIFSIGMFEHVGYKNYATYFQKVQEMFKDNGLFLLHTIGSNISELCTDRWINKYIFPNGMIPSVSQIGQSYENVLIMEDWHNFGQDYAKTLMAWHARFIEHWPKLQETYDNTFKRMWEYYLLQCAGVFRARDLQVWQIVFSRHGWPQGYTSIR